MEEGLELRDTVHTELLPAAAGLRAPESTVYVRNAPDAQLIDLVVAKVLVPIVTTILTALISRTLAKRSENDAVGKLQAEIAELRKRIDTISNAACVDASLDDEIDAVVIAVAGIRARLPGPHDIETGALRDQIASVLKSYHLPPAIARSRAEAIVNKVFSRG
jgi:hypothetical protein